MASIREVGEGKRRRYVVNYQDEKTLYGLQRRFRSLDEAMGFLWLVEMPFLTGKGREKGIAGVNRWPLKKLVWLWLGYQHGEMMRERLAISSYRRYTQELTRLPPALLGLPLSQLTPRRIVNELTPTAQRYFRMAFTLLIKHGLILVNPVISPKVYARKALNIPREGVIVSMLGAAGRREQIAIWLGAVCGLRIGEALALTYRDVSAGEVAINRHLTARGVVHGTKRGFGRVVDMPPELFALLDVELMGTSAPVIAGRTGEGLSLNYSKRGIMKNLLTRFGVDRFHDLRHFAVSNVISRGASLPDVMAFAGHSDATVTLKVYGHLFRKKVSLRGMLGGVCGGDLG